MPQLDLSFVLELSSAAFWFWALLLIAAVWLRRHLHVNAAENDPALCPADADRNTGPLPKLTVLVAGKDEEENIGTCLAGLLAQDYPDFNIIAINDRSGDRTAAILDECAAHNPRLRVMHVRELPAGWGGKNHAMHTGVQHAEGEYLCLTDADCRFPDRRLLRAAMRVAQQKQVDLLSVLPQLEAKSFWEWIVQPPAGAIMVYWFPPKAVNDPASRTAYANGAFMLIKRAAYARIGGHADHKLALNEDMHFARRIKAEGLRLYVLRGGGMYTVRMYTGLRQIWNGWTRIFYACFGTWLRLIVSVLFLSIFSLLPWISLLAAPFLPEIGLEIGLAAGAAAVAQQTVLWRFYKLCALPSPMALTYPLGAALCLAITFNAMRRLTGTRTTWRGTTYQGGV
ncbi:MAG: glycosyltransferase [Phycisphaerales bacterium]|nr:glycosyltransferase [Phycisphaerales bacterium]